MNTICVVRGVGTTPTEMASYDAALAAANIHNYSLVAVLSVVPADTTIETVDMTLDLGLTGNRLTVMQAREITATPSEAVIAGLGWTTGPGPGLFYETSRTDENSVRAVVIGDLEAGRNLREWSFDDEEVTLTAGTHEGEGYTAAVTIAAYGQSESVL